MFHTFECFLLTILLIETCESKVAPSSRKGRIALYGEFPVRDCKVVLSFVVIKTTKQVRSYVSLWVLCFCCFECAYSFKTVRETVCRICLLTFLCLTHIEICHRSGSVFCNGNLPYVVCLSNETCRLVVEGEFIVVVVITMHESLQLLKDSLVVCEQILLVEGPIVEEVEGERLVDEIDAWTTEFAEYSSLESTSLVIVPIVIDGTVEFFECIIPTLLNHGDLRCFEIAGISPSFIPCSFPETLISLISLTLVFEGKGEVVYRFTVIWIRIALGDEFHSFAQVFLCLVETSFADEPESHCIKATDIVRVAAQSFFIIISSHIGSMTILFDVEPSEVELFVCLHLFGQ